MIINIKEGDSENVGCPSGNECPLKLTPSMVKSSIPEYLFCRWDDLLYQRALDKMEDVIYCPVKSCLKPCIPFDGDQQLFFCDACKGKFCKKCQKPTHKGPCDAAENAERDMNWVRQHSRPCPKCRTAIQKNEGCNHMTCRCGVSTLFFIF